MNRNLNWFGLAAGVITLIVLVISLYIPWWQLTIGQNLMKVNASPVNTNFGVFGTQFTIPLIWAINLVSILTFTASGIVMLIYSLNPTKLYSKHLLSFSYKKPLYALITFVAGLIAVTVIAGLLGISISLTGSTTLTIPSKFLPSGASISALISGSFQLPFWLATAAAALCIGARLYHSHIPKTPKMELKVEAPLTQTVTTPVKA